MAKNLTTNVLLAAALFASMIVLGGCAGTAGTASGGGASGQGTPASASSSVSMNVSNVIGSEANAAESSDTAESAQSPSRKSAVLEDGNAIFGCSQFYDGKLYIGDLRTMGGDRRIANIPGSEEPPVSTEHFRFADNVYYYIENFAGNGSGSVKLHAVDLATGADIVLAQDVAAPTTAMMDGKTIALESYSKEAGDGISVVDVSTGKETRIAEKRVRLYGIYDGYCYASDWMRKPGADLVLNRYPVDGGKPEVVLTLDDGASVVGMYGNVILTCRDDVATAYGVDGGELWQRPAPIGLDHVQNLGKAYYSDGCLYYSMEFSGANGFNRTDPKSIARLSIADGGATEYKTELPYIMSIAYADDEAIYYCGMEDGSAESMVENRFGTYRCSLRDGESTKLGEQ